MSDVSTVLSVEVPSKWDIIPIHTSDRTAFKACRRRWNWSSPARSNLVPRARIHGIIEPLWFGTGIHHALEKMYNPYIQEDAVVAFESWFDLQMNGGLVTADELKEFVDRRPVVEGELFKVDGLKHILPDYDPDHFEEVRKLGVAMMSFYQYYAEKHDNFKVIATEHSFSVPLLDREGNIIYALDTRNMPDDWPGMVQGDPTNIPENNYGPLWKTVGPPDGYVAWGIVKQVHARGKMDLIVQDNETGRYGLIDHKTAKSINEDYFRHLDLDEQVTTYAWAAEQEAILHDLPYKSIDFIVYQAILKDYPRPPTITSRGLPSVNRNDECTTAEMFAETIQVLGLQSYYEADSKMQSYYDYLVGLGDDRFINRYVVRRNKHQKYSCGIRLTLEAQDMINPRIYPNPTKDYTCLNCIFRTPCVAVEDGSDWQSMITDGFEENHDR